MEVPVDHLVPLRHGVLVRVGNLALIHLRSLGHRLLRIEAHLSLLLGVGSLVYNTIISLPLLFFGDSRVEILEVGPRRKALRARVVQRMLEMVWGLGLHHG